MFETGAYRFSTDLIHRSRDGFIASWEIIMRQHIASTQENPHYRDVCIGPCLVSAAMYGRPYPDVRIPVTQMLPYEQNYSDYQRLATMGCGPVQHAQFEMNARMQRPARDAFYNV